MDLRELQALHARYSDSPMVIDLPGQLARIPALPLPTAEGTPVIDRHLSHDAQHILATVGKILLALVAAGVVAAAGMQGATIWHKFHRASAPSSLTASETVPTQTRAAAVPTVAHVAPLASTTPESDFPALTAQDFAVPSAPGAKANGLSRLSLADLSRQAVAAPVSKTVSTTASTTDDQQAMAAPIRAHRAQPVAGTTVVEAAPAPQPAQSSQAVKTAQAPEPAAAAPAPVETKPAPTAADAPDTKPTTPRHREHKHAKAAAESAATGSDKPAPAASRGGADVPLF